MLGSKLPLNKMSSAVAAIDKYLPVGLRHWGYTYMFNSQVKLAGTAGIRIRELDRQRAVVTLANKTKVQNHIGSVHACGMALVSESSTGILLGMNVPDSHVMVIKSMKVEYVKRAVGDLQAVASLTPEQLQRVHTEDKGDFVVDVKVTDGEGKQPINCEMVWAWIPKKRKPKVEQQQPPPVEESENKA